ncbi:MAG: response regulator [Elusimicrobia bacterium]|nr:response regulator [Elusimicrobiota bacterium]
MADQEKKPVILVIDDLPEITCLLRVYLEGHGFKVYEATTCHQALALAEEKDPDLVVCDVIMPVMQGWELCQKLKARFAPKRLPVIMLTCKSAELDEIRSYESQADAHLTKPPILQDVLKTIQRLLKIPA